MDVEMLLGCETAVVVFEGLRNCFLFAFQSNNSAFQKSTSNNQTTNNKHYDFAL